jgi:hypothetical protein
MSQNKDLLGKRRDSKQRPPSLEPRLAIMEQREENPMREEAKVDTRVPISKMVAPPRRRGQAQVVQPPPSSRGRGALPEGAPPERRGRTVDRRSSSSLMPIPPISTLEAFYRANFFTIHFSRAPGREMAQSVLVFIRSQSSPAMRHLFVSNEDSIGVSAQHLPPFSSKIFDETSTDIRQRIFRITEAMYNTFGFGPESPILMDWFRISPVGVITPNVSLENFFRGTFDHIDLFLRKTFKFVTTNEGRDTTNTFLLNFPMTTFHTLYSGGSFSENSIGVLDAFISRAIIAIYERLVAFSPRIESIRVIIDPILNTQNVVKNLFRIPTSTFSIIPTEWSYPVTLAPFEQLLTPRSQVVTSVIWSFILRFLEQYETEDLAFDIESIDMSITVRASGRSEVFTKRTLETKIRDTLRNIQAQKKSGFTLPEVVEGSVLNEKIDLRINGESGTKKYDCMDLFLFATVYTRQNHAIKSIEMFEGVKIVSSTMFFRQPQNTIWSEYKNIKHQGYEEVLSFISNRLQTPIDTLLFLYGEDGYPKEIIFPQPRVEIVPLAIVFVYYENGGIKVHVEFSLSSHLLQITRRISAVRNLKALAFSISSEDKKAITPFSYKQSFDIFWKQMRIPSGSRKSTAFFRKYPSKQKESPEDGLIQIFWDIETFSSDLRPPFLSVLREGEVTTIFKGEDCVKKTLEYLINFTQNIMRKEILKKHKTQIIIWSYNGSRFDHMYLLPHIQKGAILGTKTFAKGLMVPVTIQADEKIIEQSIYFYDFCLTMGGGLERAYKEVVPEGVLAKKAFNVDASKFDAEYISQNEIQIEQYCINDTVLLQTLVLTFFDNLRTSLPHLVIPQIGISASSLAWKVFSANYLPICQESGDFLKTPHSLFRGVHNVVRSSYFGGFTQCFMKEMERGYYYDINSSYPSVMLNPVPLKHVWGEELAGIPAEDLIILHFLKNWSFPINFPYPSIPVRRKTGNYYPRTGQNSWVWDHYLDFAVKTGLQWEEDTSQRLYFTKGDIFSKYIQDFYDIKVKSSGGLKVFAKLLLNSLYGKCGEDEHDKLLINDTMEISKEVEELLKEGKYLTKSVEFLEGEQNLTTLSPNLQCDPTHIGSLVHIASWITSAARLELHKVILSIHRRGGIVYYCDTDSIFTNIPLEENMVSFSELGKWKLEYEVEGGRFWGLKMYSVQEKGKGKHTHIKGLQTKKITPELEEDLWNLPIDIGEWNEEQMKKVWITPTFNRTWGAVIDKPFFKIIQQTCELRRNFKEIFSVPWDFINEEGLGWMEPQF